MIHDDEVKLSANNHIAKGGFTMDGMDCFDSVYEVSDDPTATRFMGLSYKMQIKRKNGP